MYYAIAYIIGIFISLLIFPKTVYKNPEILLENCPLKDNSPKNRKRVACELSVLVCFLWPIIICYVTQEIGRGFSQIGLFFDLALTFVAKIFVKEMRDG